MSSEIAYLLQEYQRAWAQALVVHGDDHSDDELSLASKDSFADSLKQSSSFSKAFRLHQYDGLKVYQGLLRGGVMGCFEGLFPKVYAALPEKQRWVIMEAFRKECPNTSPQFAPMFSAFSAFLSHRADVPEALVAMARFEWAQVEARHAPAIATSDDAQGSLVRESPEALRDELMGLQCVINPTMSVLEEKWPLHQCDGEGFLANEMSWPLIDTCLIVFRHPLTHKVKTFSVTPLVSVLIRALMAAEEANIPIQTVLNDLYQGECMDYFQGVGLEALYQQIPSLIVQWVSQGVVTDLKKF